MTSVSYKRKTGIAAIGDLPWGTHFCQFYTTKKDLLDTLVPYFKAGLEDNEQCVWVTSSFLGPAEAVRALRRNVPGFSDYEARGQMEVFPDTDWYLRGGSLDLKRTLDMWMKKHDRALARGFDGLRISGNPYWINNDQAWDDFTRYEAEIDAAIVGTRLLALCAYSLKKCGVAEIIDVVKNHEFALAMDHGAWQLVDSPGKDVR
jgi:hypothetical protein